MVDDVRDGSHDGVRRTKRGSGLEHDEEIERLFAGFREYVERMNQSRFRSSARRGEFGRAVDHTRTVTLGDGLRFRVIGRYDRHVEHVRLLRLPDRPRHERVASEWPDILARHGNRASPSRNHREDTASVVHRLRPRFETGGRRVGLADVHQEQATGNRSKIHFGYPLGGATLRKQVTTFIQRPKLLAQDSNTVTRSASTDLMYAV